MNIISEEIIAEGTMTFFECLVEAYRKQVVGRTEFKLGNKTTVIVNPTHADITKVYDTQKKKKNKNRML